MRSYQELFRTPEFTPLFLTAAVQVAAQTMAGLGLATLVLRSTGSPFLSALALFGPALAQVVGAATLLSAADRLPPRAALAGISLVFALGTAAQAVPGLPTGAVFGLLLVQGLVGSVGGGVRYGLLGEVLPRAGHLLGRSVLNMAAGVCQIAGFAAGGVLVATVSPRGTLLIAAGLHLAAGLLARRGLSRRGPRATGRPSAAETWRTNARLWSSRPRRLVYLALWVPNGLIVGCESLFVAYAPDAWGPSGTPDSAGLLFACAALGMLIGDTVVGRLLPTERRAGLGPPLQALLAAPYLLFALDPGLPLALVAVTVSGVGYGASLIFQERLLALVPDELRGHALGLHSAGMPALQGLSAALAGAVAQLTSPAVAMTVLAAVSLAVGGALVLTEGPSSGPRPSPRRARRRTA
ncbi:MFS transporter [Streptomyces sp. NPDC047971]|uniref:MFS transporter n=1 Tax=Streptomyces sp. NPDC047971 TaxID=3154499 RepID=UPI003405C43F